MTNLTMRMIMIRKRKDIHLLLNVSILPLFKEQAVAGCWFNPYAAGG